MAQDVVVAGAGPTGLTLACELARRGVRVTVLDSAGGPATGSRAKGLQPRGLELLDRLDVAGRLVSLGTATLPVRSWSTGPDGEPVVTDRPIVAGAEPGPGTPFPAPMIVPQWRTEEALRERLAELGVAVRWSTRVTGVEQDTDGVTVLLDGADPLRARWLVGCDGGRSVVRRALGTAFLGETDEDLRLLLGDVELSGLDRDHWHRWSTPQQPMLMLCPLPATASFQFQGLDLLEPGSEPTLADFQAAVERAGAGGVRVRAVRWSSRWRLNVRMVDSYRTGRVLLAGDAAHVHSPAGGQGMNTGIGDAANLGWKLAAVVGGARPELLDSYEAERLPVAAHVLDLSSRVTGRPIGERGPDGTTGLQLGLTYRGGPLAAGPDGRRPGDGEPAPGDPGAGPRSGDRAPDAPVRTPDGVRTSLFALLRDPRWVLLGFGVVPPEVDGVRSVTVLPAGAAPAGPGETVLDHAGHAVAGYAPAPGELVLIRPDGHVGMRSAEPVAVRRYLAGLLAPISRNAGSAQSCA